MIGEVQRATHGKFAGYLTKPVSTSALLECIDRAIRLRDASPAQAPALVLKLVASLPLAFWSPKTMP